MDSLPNIIEKVRIKLIGIDTNERWFGCCSVTFERRIKKANPNAMMRIEKTSNTCKKVNENFSTEK